MRTFFDDKLIYQRSALTAPVKINNLPLLNTSQFKGKSNACMQLSSLKSNYYFVSKPFVTEQTSNGDLDTLLHTKIMAIRPPFHNMANLENEQSLTL